MIEGLNIIDLDTDKKKKQVIDILGDNTWGTVYSLNDISYIGYNKKSKEYICYIFEENKTLTYDEFMEEYGNKKTEKEELKEIEDNISQAQMRLCYLKDCKRRAENIKGGLND